MYCFSRHFDVDVYPNPYPAIVTEGILIVTRKSECIRDFLSTGVQYEFFGYFAGECSVSWGAV